MGLDFDVLEFCKKLRQDRPPPYQCPLEKCDRVYKSLCGLQYHLVNYDHDNPTPITPAIAPNRKKGRARAPVPTGDIALQSPPKEALTFAEAQKVVQFEIDGKISRINIDQVLPVISLDDWNKKNSELEKPIPFLDPTPEPHVKLPEASFHEIDDYNIADAPPRPNAYIRFIEKSAEELDGEVEYDVDEEDTAWLSILNEKRQKQNLAAVSVDTLELLMDRLEKESFFQAAQSGQSSGTVVDEDAVCCICMDGECQNTNVILFCDMCNLAVHQDCYGVPYIPEGQWLCRRCLQSPSRLVDCELCPNTGGALKQTDRGTWAHVVCALWIPEVRFANTVFLEPIDSIETIPMARWKLTCYVCKQKGVGACIQCHKTNCYAAFHVTCAQHAGLYMKMDAVNGPGRGGALDPAQAIQVAKMAYCDAHTPPGVLRERQANNNNNNNPNDSGIGGSSANQSSASSTPNKKQAIKAPPIIQRREKMKEARRMLAKKRSSVPVVLIPTIPPDRVQEIASLVNMAGRAPFVQRLIAYWTLKRQYRNGVPLLRRLQSLNHHSSGGGRSGLQDGSVDSWELYSQLKYWQRIRQDLERARLLCELVRKRERMKAEFTRVSEKALMHQLKPVQATLRKLLNTIMTKDTSDIFSEPVDPTEVPDYSSVVTHPMDLSTMSQKLDKDLYLDLDTMEKDFKLMIDNCLAYNSKDTVFYKAGVKMMDQCSVIFKQARKDMMEAGMIQEKQPIKEPSTTPTKSSIEKTPTKKFRDRKASTSAAVITPVKEEDLNEKMEEEINLLMSNKHPTEDEIRKVNNIAAKWKKSSQFQASPRLAKKLKSALQVAEKRMTSGGRKRRRTRGHSEDSRESENEEAEQQTPVGDGGRSASASTANKRLACSPPGTPHTPIPSERTPTKRSPMPAAGTPSDPSPTGVNRRTAVLFTRKAQSAAAFGTTTTASVGTTTPKIPRRSELAALTAGGTSPNIISGSSSRRPSATPTGNSADSTMESMSSPSKNPSANETPSKKKGRGRPRKHNKNSDRNKGHDKMSGTSRQTSVGSQTVVPLSFLEYRGPRDEVGSGVDSDSAHSTASFTSSCSSCTPLSDDDASSCDDACSYSSSGSDNSSYVRNRSKSSNQFFSDTENSVTRMSGKISSDIKGTSGRQWSTEEGSDGESSQATSTKERKRGRTPSKKANVNKGGDVEKLDTDNLEPLSLVWAKCRGYPWYPALIIDPKIPKGFIHNGVPLPVPPQDVLALKKNHMHEPILYLVLFFDAKRTWQWLPPNKLEPLGIKKSIDQAKLVESRKPADRKAVKKAYQDAMQYRKQVDGEQFTSK